MKIRVLLIGVIVLGLSACSGVYYSAMEKVGYAKREILADRVAGARDAQEEAQEQFTSALDRFRSVVQFDGGKLEEKYEALQTEYDSCNEVADQVKSRIEGVEDVAEALFDEWAAELEQYTSSKLKRSSERRLTDTKRRYAKLIAAMWKAEEKIGPVLAAFNDQVLYLKHHLNARAVSSLEGELVSIQGEVRDLVREMEKAVTEANLFITDLEKE